MTVLEHGYVLTMDEKLSAYPDGYVVFDEKGIAYVGDTLPSEYQSLSRTDCKGTLVIPGFCNTHTHMSMVPFRSLGDDRRDRLHSFLMPLEDEVMGRELAVVSAKMAMAEMLLGGTTSAVDMYYFEEDIAKASQELGFRLWAGETLLDKEHCDAAGFEEGLDLTDRLLSACKGLSLVTPIVAPHAPYSLSVQHLRMASSYARSKGLMWTMHLSEMPFEVEAIRKEHGCTPVEWMEQNGLLDSSLLAVHLITLSEHDKDLLAHYQVPMSHCPVSNLKAGKGTSPVLDLIDRGVVCTLGTDGPSSGNTLDMFPSLRTAELAQKTIKHDRGLMPAVNAVMMATRNAGKALQAPIGMLKQGYQADISVLSLDSPAMHPFYDPYSVLCYSASRADVQDVYVAGVQRVADRRLVGLDLGELYKEFAFVSKDFKAEALRRLALPADTAPRSV